MDFECILTQSRVVWYVHNNINSTFNLSIFISGCYVSISCTYKFYDVILIAILLLLYDRDSGVNATNVQRQYINKDGHDANKSVDTKGRGWKARKVHD